MLTVAIVIQVVDKLIELHIGIKYTGRSMIILSSYDSRFCMLGYITFHSSAIARIGMELGWNPNGISLFFGCQLTHIGSSQSNVLLFGWLYRRAEKKSLLN